MPNQSGDLSSSDGQPSNQAVSSGPLSEETTVSQPSNNSSVGGSPVNDQNFPSPGQADLPAKDTAASFEPVQPKSPLSPPTQTEATDQVGVEQGVTPTDQEKPPLGSSETAPPTADFSPPTVESVGDYPAPTSPPSSGYEPLTPPDSSISLSSASSAGPKSGLGKLVSSGLIKKILLLILAALAGFGIVWGVFRFVIGGGESSLPGKEGAKLTYWGLWEPEAVMETVLNEWKKDHPEVEVEYIQNSPEEYRERLQSALARGEGPDLFRFHNTWLPMFKDELDPVPSSVMDANVYRQAFYPVAVSSLQSGSHFLGIPLEIDTLALFYNQDIFTTAGVTPPETWEELRQLAFRLTLRGRDGKIQRAGVALGTTSNVWHWSDVLGLLMIQNGVDLTNPTGKLAEDAFSYYTIFHKTDRVWDDSLPESIYAFATGKAAMVFGFSWDVFEIKNINPDLNFKIVSVPQLPGDDVTWASFWVEGVSKKSSNRELAWEFLKLMSSEEIMEKSYESQSRVDAATRPFGEPYSRVEMASQLKADPLIAPFIQQAPQAKSWFLCSRTFDNGINDRMIKYFEDAVNGINQGQDPKGVIETVSGGVVQLLSQYGLSGGSAQ